MILAHGSFILEVIQGEAFKGILPNDCTKLHHLHHKVHRSFTVEHLMKTTLRNPVLVYD